MNVDIRAVAQGHHSVGVVVLLNDRAAFDVDLTIQGGAEAKHDAAFHLRAHVVRLQYPAAVCGTHHAQDLDLAAAHADMRNLSHDAPIAFVHGDAEPFVRRKAPTPGGAFGSGLQHRSPALAAGE